MEENAGGAVSLKLAPALTKVASRSMTDDHAAFDVNVLAAFDAVFLAAFNVSIGVAGEP